MLAKSPPENALPVVHVRDGVVLANSVDVAKLYGKEHKDVLEAIRRIKADMPKMAEHTAEISAQCFFSSTYTRKAGFGMKSEPCFEMTKRGFIVLVMGFTGKLALVHKLAWLDEYERMEEALRKPQPVFVAPSAPVQTFSLNEADYGRIATAVLQRLGSVLVQATSMMSEPYLESPSAEQPAYHAFGSRSPPASPPDAIAMSTMPATQKWAYCRKGDEPGASAASARAFPKTAKISPAMAGRIARPASQLATSIAWSTAGRFR